MSAPRLSLHDQALANALGFLACQRIEDARTALALEVLADVLPQSASPVPVMRTLRAAAAEVIDTAERRMQPRGSVPWCSALLVASAAVSEFLFWRASLAWDAARAERNPEGGRHAAE